MRFATTRSCSNSSRSLICAFLRFFRRHLARNGGGGNHYRDPAIVLAPPPLTRPTMNRSGAAIFLAALLAFAPAASRAAGPTREVLSYHGDDARSGDFVIPALTFDRARGVHPDSGFHA